MSNIVVTGCAGFIGARVCELLLADGHTVVGIDNLNDAYDVRLKFWRLERFKAHPHFHFAKLDVTDRAALFTLFQSQTVFPQGAPSPPCDAIVNLAARAGVRYSVENPWAYYETNVTGTLNLLELCRHEGIGKFVLASSSSLYGESNELPYREDQGTDLPLSPYAASKKAAEVLCHTYHHLHGIDLTVFRYFTVYGPAGRPDMMPFRLVQWICERRPVTVYGDGRQSRDFTYVDDIARGTIAGLRPLGYEVINLGSDKPVVLMDFIRLVERLTGEEAQLRYQQSHPADVRATWADVSKAGCLLGWHTQTDTEEGVAQLVEWYRRERSWAGRIATGL